MPQENIMQDFRLKEIDEIRNYLIEEISQNELMCKKQKKVFRFWIILNTHLLQFLQLLDVFPFLLLLL